ncbi:zinc finger CDGSH domain-containing protein 1 [Thraustotheca clavata]|uniref:Zinc finger CDGSH domain-containing protein 1 n=1 Tax=Thraustotheca clavata TaxID=74557 RepID=A0A1V9Z1J3_9STRA|nr:zinc finger CDGSH domain-containing protein 1 [Thraustotheca clavata]
MEAVRHALKVRLPKYLKSLPIPSTFGGFAKLNQEEWITLLPLIVTIGVLLVTIFGGFGSKKAATPSSKINKKISLEKEKVVDTCDIEDMFKGGSLKCVLCRCWKSKKFPFCDGAHNKHNKDTGDNVGPLIIEKKE